MKPHARPFLCVLILAVLASALTNPFAIAAPQVKHAAKSLGTIGGQVFSPAGFAVPGARVTLQASDGRDPQTTVTNSQGRFWFPMLSAGLYDVRATSQGRSSEWRQNVAVGIGHQTTITLHLRSKKPAPVKSPASLRKP